MASVLAQVPRPERSQVRARARRLHGVAARVPDVTRRLRWRACVHVAASAPHLAFAELSLLMRCTLWAYRLDDCAEALSDDVPGLVRLRDQVAAVAAGGEVRPVDPLLVGLARILCDLSLFDRSGEVVTRFGEAVCDAAGAELDQRRLELAVAAGADPPTVEGYLTVSSRNINYRSYAYALLAVGGYQLTRAQLRCVDPVLRHASHALRLANDVRGVRQDEACATLNVLGLRTTAGVVATPEFVWAEAERYQRAHDVALRALVSLGVVPAAAAQALARSLALAIGMYRRTDLR